jgi:cardiolipin synthase
MTAALSDNTTTIGAARHCYGLLLRRGARLYEYRASKLHMKLIVADDVVYIGSANYDTRSLFLNLEIMLRVEDPAFAERMRAFCRAEMAAAQEITPHWLKTASGPFRRLRWFLAWFLFSTIDYTITRRFNIGPEPRRWRLKSLATPQ